MTADQVMKVINDIAQKLGVAAEKVCPMLVKQAEVFCSTYRVTLWITGIMFALLIAFFAMLAIAYNKDIASLYFISVFGIIVCVIVLICSCCVATCQVNDYFTALQNPDWWAIEYVTKLLT